MTPGLRPLVAGNWKMHGLAADGLALARAVAAGAAGLGAELLVCPPATLVAAVATALSGTPVATGGQDCHADAKGAHTGDIAAAMLADAGARYVILGHSERRQLFGETDAGVNRKTAAVLKAGMLPIVCVGETLEEREGGKTLGVVETQVKGCLQGFTPADGAKFVIAYEPVWAIGTGKTATSRQAQEVHAHIRQILTGLWGADTAQQVRIQYGGSVKADNAAELLGQPDIDGALVGGASLKAADFAAIVKAKA